MLPCRLPAILLISIFVWRQTLFNPLSCTDGRDGLAILVLCMLLAKETEMPWQRAHCIQLQTLPSMHTHACMQLHMHALQLVASFRHIPIDWQLWLRLMCCYPASQR